MNPRPDFQGLENFLKEGQPPSKPPTTISSAIFSFILGIGAGLAFLVAAILLITFE